MGERSSKTAKTVFVVRGWWDESGQDMRRSVCGIWVQSKRESWEQDAIER